MIKSKTFCKSCFCGENKIRYTRYADDLSFSSDERFSGETVNKIKAIIQNNGFTVNTKKIRLQSSKSRQTVTGLVVNQKVNVDRRYIRQLRAILHHWKKEGLKAAAARHDPAIPVQSFILKIRGRLNFLAQVRGVHDPLYLSLQGRFAELCESD